jgi:hypothetical protein
MSSSTSDLTVVAHTQHTRTADGAVTGTQRDERQIATPDTVEAVVRGVR